MKNMSVQVCCWGVKQTYFESERGVNVRLTCKCGNQSQKHNMLHTHTHTHTHTLFESRHMEHVCIEQPNMLHQFFVVFAFVLLSLFVTKNIYIYLWMSLWLDTFHEKIR